VSRVGKKPIDIKDVTITQSGNTIKVKGKLGELERTIHPNMKVEVKENELIVTRPNDWKENRAFHKRPLNLLKD